jgi:hypothetical protein
MTGPSKPLTPTELPWFHIGRPWADKPGLIYAGSEDPHVGTFVVSVDDWPDEVFFGQEPDKDVAAIAERIVADHNAALAARSSSAPAELDVEALAEVLNTGRYTGSMTAARGWANDIATRYAARLTSSPENPR